MRQSVLVGPRQSRVEEVPVPTVGREDVLVRVKACGVCASELHSWMDPDGSYPTVLGHEVAGEVVATGDEVTDIRVGMPVTGLFHRGYGEYVAAHRNSVLPIPSGLDYSLALGEPLGCIISGARRTRVEPGDTVALVGLGFMGLLMLQAVRLKGPKRIIAIDVRTEALKAALDLGADEALLPEEVGDSLKLIRWDQLGRNHGVDVAIEASGTQPGLTLAGQMVREHGVLSIVGYHQGGDRQVDMELWNWKALDVTNAHERRFAYLMDCMRRGLDLVSTGKIDMAPLVTHRFSLYHVDDAFAALLAKPAGFRKAIVVPDAR